MALTHPPGRERHRGNRLRSPPHSDRGDHTGRLPTPVPGSPSTTGPAESIIWSEPDW